MRNELDKETSPYLLQHRDNPVHWQTWSKDTIATSRQADKPILLSVGYAACHWCHVMAHESFEDPDTAALMNELFINVKVDREERPDLDMIYQAALAITGQQDLMETAPAIRESIHLRDGIIMPLLVIQQFALTEMERQTTSDPSADPSWTPALLRKLIIRTMYGIVNASRNAV